MKRKKTRGVLYIAKNPDSFQKLYEGVRDSIFLPALRSLPTADELKDRMSKGIEKAEKKRGVGGAEK